jgi:threonine aldolase
MDAEKTAVRARCTRALSHHHARDLEPRNVLTALAESTPEGLAADVYGEGELIAAFEAEIATLLGKERAVFMPSGTMAQQIAMRVWSERKRIARVAFHPTCHLELHEQKGYQALHGLHAVLVGSPDRLMTLAELQNVAEPLAAVLIELPQRGIGGQLPPWEELEETAAWARERGIALHLDGARLWESQPFYGRSYAQIAALFDSAYVSLYKILGGIAGAVLAGEATFVTEARVWQRRHGGTLVHQYPYLLAARAGMTARLPRIAAYCERARALAARLVELGLQVVPDPPHANMMHVFLRGDRERLERAALEHAREREIWLFGALSSTPLPDLHKFELTVGDATLALSMEEIEHELRLFLARARALA